jgi:tetratricopeptide (TPR) repeat protein
MTALRTSARILSAPALRRRPRPAAIVVGAVAIAMASYAVAGAAPELSRPPMRTTLSTDLVPADAVTDARPLDDVDAAIGAWSANLAAEPADFVSAIHLGELYLSRARLSGDAADGTRAAEAAGRALEIDPGLDAALLLRAQAAHVSHDFRAAEADALAVLANAPDAPEALATLGDARLELGDYQRATEAYARLAELATGPAVDARLARLAASTGRLDDARRLAATATHAATGDSPTTVAWYHGLEASLAFQAGDLAAAEDRWRAAIALWDGAAAAHAGLGRTLAARGDLSGARAALERSVAIQPQPEALTSLAAVDERLGDPAAAAVARSTLLALGDLGTSDRQLARFLADRGEDAQRAVDLARADLATRGDAYAHDALAWALLAAGRVAEADAEMRLARAAGIEDALLDYHDGLIAAAAGRTDDAIGLLEAALARNPGFDVVGADRARATLAELRGEDRP